MLEGVFKFKGVQGPVWIDLSSVDAFVYSAAPSMGARLKDSIARYDVLFRNGKLTQIMATEQEIDEVIKQHRTDEK